MAGSGKQHLQPCAEQGCFELPLSKTQDAEPQHLHKAAARSFPPGGSFSCGASNTTQARMGGAHVKGEETDLPGLVEFSSETKPVLGDAFRGSPRGRNDPPIQGPGLEQLVKGAWSKEEDRILLQHVSICGEKDWNRVKKVYGLRRSGKSCRLRYVNHLRPNLRRHRWSSDEERLLLELQSQHGNKWARIAKHLPGRTDNEVKNAWHVRRKKEQRELEKAAKHKAEVRSGVRLASCESSANVGEKSMARSQGKAKSVQTKGTQVGPPGIPLRRSAQSDTKDLMCSEQLFEDPRTNPPNADFGAGKVVIGVPIVFPGLALPDGSYPATWNRSFALCTGYPAEGLFPRSTVSSASCSLGLHIPVDATSQPPPVTSSGSPRRRRVSTEAPFVVHSLGCPRVKQNALASNPPTKALSVISTGCAKKVHVSSPRPSVQSSGSSVGDRRSSDALSSGPFGPLKRQSPRPLSAVDSSRSSSFCCHVAKMERVASTGASLSGGLVGEEVHALPSPGVRCREGGSCKNGAPPALSACWDVPERLAPPAFPAPPGMLSPPELVVPPDPMAEDAIWADRLFLSPIGPVRTISPVGELLPSGFGPLLTPRFASPDPVLGMQARMDGLGALLTSRDMEYGLEGPSNDSGPGVSPTALFPEWPVLPFPGVVPLLEDRDSQTDNEN